MCRVCKDVGKMKDFPACLVDIAIDMKAGIFDGGIYFFWSGLQGPKAYSLWYGVVPKLSIG